MDWVIKAYAYDGDAILLILSNGNAEIEFCANVGIEGRTLVLRRFHAHGGGANLIGHARVRAIADWALLELKVDELRVEGYTRTTGANPGRLPRPLVFFRRGRAGDASSGR